MKSVCFLSLFFQERFQLISANSYSPGRKKQITFSVWVIILEKGTKFVDLSVLILFVERSRVSE